MYLDDTDSYFQWVMNGKGFIHSRISLSNQFILVAGRSLAPVVQAVPNGKSHIVDGDSGNFRRMHIFDDGKIILLGVKPIALRIFKRSEALSVYHWDTENLEEFMWTLGLPKNIGLSVLSTPGTRLIVVTTGYWEEGITPRRLLFLNDKPRWQDKLEYNYPTWLRGTIGATHCEDDRILVANDVSLVLDEFLSDRKNRASDTQ